MNFAQAFLVFILGGQIGFLLCAIFASGKIKKLESEKLQLYMAIDKLVNPSASEDATATVKKNVKNEN